jgi:trans-aconitate methyltransferase
MSSTAPPSTPETDSTYGGGYEGDRTVPLTPTATNYYEYNGRRYHGAHLYPYPNDEAEMDFLEMQHEAFLKNLHGKLFLAPISTPSNILDVGTGTGVWAIDVADQYPEAVVTGTDISPIQHNWVPPNCNFLVEDAKSTWGFATKFDFIHCRQLRMCLDERKLFTQALESLQPGGWLEVVEMTLPLICDDSTSEGAALRSWGEDMTEASKTLKTPFDKPYYYRQWMEEAGFVNVREVRHDVAMNPDDEELKELGELQKTALLCGLEGYSLQTFRRLYVGLRRSFRYI